jgi:hypothetical protein
VRASCNALALTPRANPSPKVTDPFCRLTLPTFVAAPRYSRLGPDAVLYGRPGRSSPRFSRPSHCNHPLVCSPTAVPYVQARHDNPKQKKSLPGAMQQVTGFAPLPSTVPTGSGLSAGFPFVSSGPTHSQRIPLPAKPFPQSLLYR